MLLLLKHFENHRQGIKWHSVEDVHTPLEISEDLERRRQRCGQNQCLVVSTFPSLTLINSLLLFICWRWSVSEEQKLYIINGQSFFHNLQWRLTIGPSVDLINHMKTSTLAGSQVKCFIKQHSQTKIPLSTPNLSFEKLVERFFKIFCFWEQKKI